MLDEAVGVRLKVEKSKVAEKETEWLGYKQIANGKKTVDEKVLGITDKLRPKNLRDLRYPWER